MFKFVPDHVGGVGTKRKQAQKSCESCKKRHKRCPHAEPRASHNTHTSLSPPSPSGTHKEGGSRHLEGFQGVNSVRRASTSILAGATSDIPSNLENGAAGTRPRSNDAYLRFVGDLSPEASFLSNQRRGAEINHSSRHAEVGVWLGQRPETQEDRPSRGENGAINNRVAQDPSAQHAGLTGLRAISSHLRQECLAVLPPEYELGIITSLYYAKVDPMFPILREEVFDSYSPTESVALKQCICLVAALDPKVRKHLRLPHTERILSPTEFRAYVSAAVKQSLDMEFIHDKVVLLQVCVLMAFYADRANCSEVSTYYVSQAVHHSQTLGLHLGWPDDGTRAEKSRRIFWCIWVLDRLNAATNGRPILMHRQDMDMRILETCTEQAPPFRLLIRITQFLDNIISRYRPHPTDGAVELVDERLTFEDLVQETKAESVGSALLATLEVFYLAVVILRYRPRESEGQTHPVPSSDIQLFAATSIISIASEDFKFAITFWPVVPYAVSLVTSVAYKSLRNSCMAYRRKRAYSLFHSSCDVLDELSKSFSSARTVAKLATDTMQEVERVAADRSKARQSFKAGPGSSRPLRGGVQPPQGRRVGTAASTTPDENEPITMQPEQQPIENMAMYQAPLDNTLLHLESPSVFDDFIGDAGIFNDFDPSFDLDRIDQVFSANLDPTQPLSSQDWMGHLQLG